MARRRIASAARGEGGYGGHGGFGDRVDVEDEGVMGGREVVGVGDEADRIG